MLGAVGKAQRTGSKTRLRDRDRELKLTGVPSGPNPALEGPPICLFLYSPPGSEHHSFLIPMAQAPELFHTSPSLPLRPLGLAGQGLLQGRSEQKASRPHLLMRGVSEWVSRIGFPG